MSATVAPVGSTAGVRPTWRAVAIPAEHGGWGLTAEPALLGLLVARSWAGAALAVAAVGAFLVRTPLKLAVVDARRGRSLDRTRLARRVAGVELAIVLLLAALAFARAGAGWLVPVAVAVPLVAIELWFDVRSRGRRLVPELCGAVGIAAVAAAVVVAGGGGARLSAACWLVLAGRSVGAIPFVRARIRRLRAGTVELVPVLVAQAAAVAFGVAAVVLDRRAVAGAVALVALAVGQAMGVPRPAVPPRVLGMRQLALGVGLVVMTAAGVLAG